MKSIPHADIHKAVKLKEYGYKSVEVCSPYEILRLIKDEPKSIIILFSSGKLLVQTSKDNERKVIDELNKAGIEANADELISEKILHGESSGHNKTKKISLVKTETQIEKEEKNTIQAVQQVRNSYHLIIGSDESLKGDTFGGIVVAAVFADEGIRNKLIKLKVCDSKLLTDDAIRRIAPEIMDFAPYYAENMFPKAYNNFEVTPLLNRLHKECADAVRKMLIEKGIINEEDMRCKKENVKHVVDKYPGCKTGDIITEKAESKYIEVAAASIIARYFAIKQIEELSRLAGFIIPFGSTHVDFALKRLKEKSDYGELDYADFVKTKFSNVRRFFSN